MLGSVVLLRLPEQYTLAAVGAVHNEDTVDLRAFVLYADGHLGVCELSGVQRGPGVNQWTEPPWPIPEPVPAPTPALASVQADLMPAAQLPPMPPFPLMVIIRY